MAPTSEGAHEVREVLARLQRGDREHERRCADRLDDLRGHPRGVAEPGEAEWDHRQATGGAQPRPEDLLDLVGDELRARVHVTPRAIARRTSGTSARTSGVQSSGYRTKEQS